jgi:hypothetical protein
MDFDTLDRDQRVLIQAGGAGEKRRANADDCSMAFGGPISGNAPIKSAARTPSSKPKIILRAFGRMITARPLSTLAAQELAGSGKRALSAPE